MTSHYDRFSDIKRSQFGRIIGFITDEESSSSESDEDITLLPQLIKETPERNTCIGDDVGVFFTYLIQYNNGGLYSWQ